MDFAVADNKRMHLIIKGRVQGVCFRYYCQEIARKLGLSGWVCNLDNGDVEVVCEGTQENLNALLEWCRKGPPYAVVKDIEISYGIATGDFTDFEITY
jgi:acylphosphatase